MARLTRAVALVAVAVVCSGHVGSPDTWFQGQAGPYAITIIVKTPGVVPGLAQITIRTAGGDVASVTAQPIHWNAGPEGAPPPEVAKPLAGQPGTYTTQLWLMVSGAYRVRITVTGGRGSGTADVPVNSLATKRLDFPVMLVRVLGLLGAVLFVGFLNIVRASVSEGVTPPGVRVEPRRRNRSWGVTAVAAGFAGVLVFGGRTWWLSADARYRRGIYRPFEAEAEAFRSDSSWVLRFTITDSLWGKARNPFARRSWTPLIPEHGKLMHLFAIKTGAMDGFAHLHPVSLDSANFLAALAPMPAGRYRLFADVVHESGFSHTLVSEVELPAAPLRAGNLDPDDAFFMGPAVEKEAPLADGATLVWEGKQAFLRVDQEAGLRFVLREPNGEPGWVEPYLGMAGHAVVAREDGKVFIHLHPIGTISMAAQAALVSRRPEDTVRGRLGKRLAAEQAATLGHRPHGPLLQGEFTFPYAFPEPGRYRVWVQIRRRGQVETASYQAEVR